MTRSPLNNKTLRHRCSAACVALALASARRAVAAARTAGDALRADPGRRGHHGSATTLTSSSRLRSQEARDRIAGAADRGSGRDGGRRSADAAEDVRRASTRSSRRTCRSSQASAMQRIDRLRELMRTSTRRRRRNFVGLLEAYQIEMEYGRTMDSYKEAWPTAARRSSCGSAASSLMYRTVEGGETGYWDNSRRRGSPIPTCASAIEEALQHRQRRGRAGSDHRARAGAPGRPVVRTHVIARSRCCGARCRHGVCACWRGAAQRAGTAAGSQRRRRQPQHAPPPPQSTILRRPRQVRAAATGRRAAPRARARAAFPRGAAARRSSRPRRPSQRRNAAEARSNALDKQWNDNEAKIAEIDGAAETARGQPRRALRRHAAGGWRRRHRAPAVAADDAIRDARREGEERAEFLRRLAGAHGAAVDHRARAPLVRAHARDDGRRQGREVQGRRSAGRQHEGQAWKSCASDRSRRRATGSTSAICRARSR